MIATNGRVINTDYSHNVEGIRKKFKHRKQSMSIISVFLKMISICEPLPTVISIVLDRIIDHRALLHQPLHN